MTLGGDDIAEVRDVLDDADAGRIIGFSLNKRGRLKGRMREVATSQQVLAVGPAAIMVERSTTLGDTPVETTAEGGNVLSDRVITDTGVAVGTVTDVIVDTGGRGATQRPAFPHPAPDAIAVSGEALVVPASAVEYITSDLAGFGDAVDRYRRLLHGGPS